MISCLLISKIRPFAHVTLKQRVRLHESAIGLPELKVSMKWKYISCRSIVLHQTNSCYTSRFFSNLQQNLRALQVARILHRVTPSSNLQFPKFHCVASCWKSRNQFYFLQQLAIVFASCCTCNTLPATCNTLVFWLTNQISPFSPWRKRTLTM